VVQNPEAKDGIQDSVAVGKPHRVANIKRNTFFLPGRKIFPGLLDHAEVQVHGLEDSRLKFSLDEMSAGPAAASNLQDGRPWMKGDFLS
jgi:hypothetical protein